MTWSYRRRIKIIPGVHLNFSKSGISTSINFIGINYKFQNIDLNPNIKNDLSPVNQPSHDKPISLTDNIFSADLHEITSQDMQGIKKAILETHKQRIELKSDLIKIKSLLFFSRVKFIFSYILLMGLFIKNIPKSIKLDIHNQEDAIRNLKEAIDNTFLNLEINFEDGINNEIGKVFKSYEKLKTSNKIWDVTGSHQQDRVITRSAASTVINRVSINFSNPKNVQYIKSNIAPIYFYNSNGADLIFYPSFVLMYKSKTDFAVVSFDELSISFNPVNFIETESVPKDSQIIDHTWAKVNKNGSRDKRYKDNYQIPVVRYGEIFFRSKTGIYEAYMFSNYESSEDFFNSLKIYHETVVSIQ